MRSLLWRVTLTVLDAEAGGPLLQGDVVVAVGVTLLEEAGGAVLHGNEGGTQRGELAVSEEAVVEETKQAQLDERRNQQSPELSLCPCLSAAEQSHSLALAKLSSSIAWL